MKVLCIEDEEAIAEIVALALEGAGYAVEVAATGLQGLERALEGGWGLIALGKPGARQEEIEAAARAAQLHEAIQRFPDGYATRVGERGAALSGGERQRVGLARAFLRDAPLLLLDEPTSALDASTEAEVLEALERLMVGRTVLLVTHRESALRGMDRVLQLQAGQLRAYPTQPRTGEK